MHKTSPKRGMSLPNRRFTLHCGTRGTCRGPRRAEPWAARPDPLGWVADLPGIPASCLGAIAGAQTVPQVFINGQLIGGYEELKRWVARAA